MDLTRFFASIRASVFEGRLTQSAVDGCEAIFASCRRNRVTNPHHVANILAQVHHETGGYMLPIKETVYVSHKDKNPSDATVIARLDRAYAAGQLSWVRTPYWKEGWFGRGMVQITHENNYRKLGDRLDVDLVGNPNLALDPSISADIAVVGMSAGLFTGKKLSDFDFPAALDAEVKENPRRIINGQDGTDKAIAKAHRQFYTALQAAGFGEALVDAPAEVVVAPTPAVIVTEPPPEKEVPVPTPAPTGSSTSKATGGAVGAGLPSVLLLLAVKLGIIPADVASDPETVLLLTAVLTAAGGWIGAYLAPRNAPTA